VDGRSSVETHPVSRMGSRAGRTRVLETAGAQSVVASQWAVADSSTKTLMVAFHQVLRAGVTKDEALRRAMLKVHRQPQWTHPYYWSPFLLIGDPRNLHLARK
jgi:CHAT domain-containing protein